MRYFGSSPIIVARPEMPTRFPNRSLMGKVMRSLRRSYPMSCSCSTSLLNPASTRSKDMKSKTPSRASGRMCSPANGFLALLRALAFSTSMVFFASFSASSSRVSKWATLTPSSFKSHFSPPPCLPQVKQPQLPTCLLTQNDGLDSCPSLWKGHAAEMNSSLTRTRLRYCWAISSARLISSPSSLEPWRSPPTRSLAAPGPS